MGIHNPLLEIAQKLEAAALKDPYFIEKKLYPNVDFYSGIIYSVLNIPVKYFDSYVCYWTPSRLDCTLGKK